MLNISYKKVTRTLAQKLNKFFFIILIKHIDIYKVFTYSRYNISKLKFDNDYIRVARGKV